jgi:hypothetical protein
MSTLVRTETLVEMLEGALARQGNKIALKIPSTMGTIRSHLRT